MDLIKKLLEGLNYEVGVDIEETRDNIILSLIDKFDDYIDDGDAFDLIYQKAKEEFDKNHEDNDLNMKLQQYLI